uniref:Putative secreted protein n=1 Tax=Anopheles darlingi TaxID=43151 RepID=A0A2M4D481_ANODA
MFLAFLRLLFAVVKVGRPNQDGGDRKEGTRHDQEPNSQPVLPKVPFWTSSPHRQPLSLGAVQSSSPKKGGWSTMTEVIRTMECRVFILMQHRVRTPMGKAEKESA